MLGQRQGRKKNLLLNERSNNLSVNSVAALMLDLLCSSVKATQFSKLTFGFLFFVTSSRNASGSSAGLALHHMEEGESGRGHS